jgi:hypothetical protein
MYLRGIATARQNSSFKSLFRLVLALSVSRSQLFETVR